MLDVAGNGVILTEFEYWRNKYMDNLRLSRFAGTLSQSYIRYMTRECEKAGGINLSQGVCDLHTPETVVETAKTAIDAGFNTYTRCSGIQELREAIAKKAGTFNNIDCNADNVVVTAGATGAFYAAAMALLDPEDEVIVFEPYYGYHVNMLNALGVKMKFYRLHPSEWSFSIAELEKLVTPRTRGILINTPGNPSGKVFSLAELKELAGLANSRNLIVFTDEIYEYFVYSGKKHISPASLPELKDRTVTVSGYSKTFSITGWRIGYCICPEAWAEAASCVGDIVYVCAPSPLQLGVASGIKLLEPEYYGELCNSLQHRRDKLCSALEHAGMLPYIPDGAYYVLAATSSIPGEKSPEKAMYVLEKAGVASVPGCAFYHDKDGDNLLRFCFARNDEIIAEACKRLVSIR